MNPSTLRPRFHSTVAIGAALCLLTGCGDGASTPTGGGGNGTTSGSGASSPGSGGSASGGGGAGTGGSGTGGDVSSDGDGDFTISGPYTPAPEVMVNDHVPQGTVSMFTMSSTKSAIYPKDIVTGQSFTRDAGIYVPKQYAKGTKAPFMVVQDGLDFYASTMAPVLDNMIAAGDLPVMIVIFVEPGPDESTPDGERSFEYDSVSEDYVNFVETELLPKVEKDYDVDLTQDPDGRAAMGGSSGGAAAFTMGWLRTDAYHRILTYSGSFCDLQPTTDHPHGAWEYHESLIASAPAKPLRVALEVGGDDLNWNTDTDHMRGWVAANKGMAKALANKGYHYRFVLAEGAGHVDAGVLQQTLPDTLRWLWRGYPVP